MPSYFAAIRKHAQSLAVHLKRTLASKESPNLMHADACKQYARGATTLADDDERNTRDAEDPPPNESRRANMRAVRNKGTDPEIRVRRYLHSKGFRFRLHISGLPGSPDIVLKRYRTAVFVHGCFWHQHPGCRRSSIPKTRTEWWAKKLRANIERDRRNLKELERDDWTAIVVWECETKNPAQLQRALAPLLSCVHRS